MSRYAITAFIVAFVGGFAVLMCAGVILALIHSSSVIESPVDVQDLIDNTASYKGRTIQLLLQLDEATYASGDKSLRDYVGRPFKFFDSGGAGLSTSSMLPSDWCGRAACKPFGLSARMCCVRSPRDQSQYPRPVQIASHLEMP